MEEGVMASRGGVLFKANKGAPEKITGETLWGWNHCQKIVQTPGKLKPRKKNPMLGGI